MVRLRAFAIALATFAFALPAVTTSAQSQDAAKTEPNVKPAGMSLFQDDATLNKRVLNINDLAQFMNGVNGAFAGAYGTAKTPEVISAVVALKPGRKARLWIVSSLKSPPDRTDVMARFKALPVPEVRDGPVAFAIRFTIAGAKAEKMAMLPPEWEQAFAGKQAILPDAITDYVWKD